MANPSNASPCCGNEITTQTPGPQGETGPAGTDGSDGINAFSTVAAAGQNVPAIGSPVTLAVDTNLWMVVGQNVFVFGAGIFVITSLTGSTSVTMTYLDYQGNTAAGNPIASGSKISPSGTQPELTIPVPVADGGTGATDKYDAAINLGIGQPASVVTVFPNQVLTVTSSLIAGCQIIIPSTGLYLAHAFVSLLYNGSTFAASKSVQVLLKDITSATTISSTTRTTGIMTTDNPPSVDIVLPFKTATLAAGDQIQIWISIETLPSAGDVRVQIASLCLVPLSLN